MEKKKKDVKVTKTVKKTVKAKIPAKTVKSAKSAPVSSKRILTAEGWKRMKMREYLENK
jgi:hypothetical protein